MNDKHHGPHCAGSCEGAAYQIEIRKLKSENEALREAAREVLRALDPLKIKGIKIVKLDSRLDVATGELAKMINAAHDKEGK